MYSNQRTDQSGSIAVFLIVSVLLGAMVIGGVYALHQRSDQVRGTQPVAVNQPDNKSNQQSDEEAKKQEAAKKEADTAKQAEEAKKKQEAAEQAQKQREEQAAKEQAQKQQATATSQPEAQVPQSGASSPALQSQEASHLPTTGPSDTLLQLVAGGIMIAIIGAYLRSYKYRFGSLLR